MSTLCDPLDCSPPGSSAHGILQARLPEWVTISFSRGSSWPRDRTWGSYVCCIAGRFFTSWDITEETFWFKVLTVSALLGCHVPAHHHCKIIPETLFHDLSGFWEILGHCLQDSSEPWMNCPVWWLKTGHVVSCSVQDCLKMEGS